MRLFSDAVWGVTKDHLKILEAAERLSYLSEYTNESTLRSKSALKGNFSEYLRDLITVKFITVKTGMFKLSISGYDCLAINSLRKRGLQIMGSNIAIGKESDIYYGKYKGVTAAIKINRLGRTSFQKVESRDIKNDFNWFSINKENCKKEAHFLKLFKDQEVPVLLDFDRHVMVMELLKGYISLYEIKVDNPDIISRKMIEFIRQFWDLGYVHGDFNEFNVMVSGDNIKVLDFPQCIPKDDPKAAFYLKRDIECVHKYFWRKHFHVTDSTILDEICRDMNITIEIDRKAEERSKHPENIDNRNE